MVALNTNITPYLAGPINSDQLAEIQGLVEKYPACSAYRILLAKAMHDSNSSRKDDYLHLASLYAGDRRHLFELIHSGFELQQAETQVATPNAIPEIELETSADTEEVEVVAEVQALSPELEQVDDYKEEIATEESAEKLPGLSGITFKGFTIEGDIEQAKEEQGIEENQPEEAEKFSAVDFEKIVTYDPTVELQPIEKETEDKVEIPFDTVVYNPEVELSKLMEEEESEDQAHDFVYWLDHISDEPSSDDVPEESASTSVDEVSDLLEKFLESKRKKPKVKREFFNPEHKAERSEIDDSEVVSESLAKLYVNQELFEKAIETYRKLSLQNPNKTATFAALIKELEEKIKQNKD